MERAEKGGSPAEKLVWWTVLALLLCACLYIAWNVPYTHDDWDWGLPIGWERWTSGALNNRYAGTLFVLAMTRSQCFKTLVVGLSMFALPLLAAELGAGTWRRARLPLTLLAGGVLLSVPMTTWQQTYGWVSSFSNFVVSGVLALLLALLVRRELLGGGNKACRLLLFPLTVVTQLFAENLTAVLAAAALVLAGYALWTGRHRSTALSLLAGALLGLALMFWNPMYGELMETGTAVGGIRSLVFPAGAGLGEMAAAVGGRYFSLVLPGLFSCYPMTCALVCAGGVWRMGKSGRPWWLLLPAALLGGLYAWSGWLVTDALRRDGTWVCPWPRFRVAGAAAVFVLLVLVIWTDRARAERWPRLLLLLGAAGLTAPFAVINEFGARCCFLSQLLLVVLGLSMLADFPWGRWGAAAAGLLLAAALVFHLRVYYVIGGCSQLREKLLREAVEQGEQSVLLPTEGWDCYYFWGRNPQSAMRADYFRQFYGLPEDMELIFLPPASYDRWPDIPEAMMHDAMVY